MEEMLETVVKHDIQIESKIFQGLHEVPRAVEMLQTGQYRGKGIIVVDEEAARVTLTQTQ